MKKQLILLVLLFLTVTGRACDACSLYEYTSLSNRSYAAFFYNSRLFNGYSHLGFSPRYTLSPQNTFQAKGTHIPSVTIQPNPKDYELYTTYEARVNFNIKNKYNLLVILPHKTSKLYFAEVYPNVGPVRSQEIAIDGVGDAIIGIERLNNYFGDVTHRLRYGLAVKLPTGQYQKRDIHNVMYDPVLQPGTGSWDFIFRGSYVAIYKEKLGLSSYINTRVNTKSTIKPNVQDDEDSKYKFGNRLNLNTNLFYVLKFGDWQIVPKAGVYHESAAYDWMYTPQTQRTVDGTGGSTTFLNTGLDINFKVLTLQTLWQLPISDRLNDYQIGNAGRLMLGIIYNFDI